MPLEYDRHRAPTASLGSLFPAFDQLHGSDVSPSAQSDFPLEQVCAIPILPSVRGSRAQHLPLLPLLRAVMLSLRLFSRLKIPMSSAFPLMTYPPALRPPLVPSSRHLQGPSHSFYTVGPSTVHSIQGEAKPMLNVAVVSPLLTSWLCCL